MTPAFLAFALAACIAWIILSGVYFRWHPLFSLLSATIGFGLVTGMNAGQLLEVIPQGFGSLVGSIGLIVVMGSVLGALLEDSGAVQELGKSMAARSNKPSLVLAFLGMLLGIPVFCDSGFIILFSLTRSMALATGTPISSMSLGLAGGLYSSHTLVPPTPGPVAAAANVGAADTIGIIMLLGVVVAIPVTLVAYVYAQWAGKRIILRSVSGSLEPLPSSKSTAWQAVVLILVPIVFIALGSVIDLFSWQGRMAEFFSMLGKPAVALLLGVTLALVMFRRHGSNSKSIDKGLRQAGVIILLTACGGALGAVLKASPLSAVMGDVIRGQLLSGAGFLLAAFFFSAVFKTAQGSTTSAMILVSALLSPMVADAGLISPLDHALLVLAIGAGAMAVSHANDSYFWVVSQFSGFTLRDGYVGMTVMTLLQGITALIAVLALFFLTR